MEEKVNERITIRIPEDTLSRMDEFMRVNGMNNRSELIRMAVEYFMDTHRNMLAPEDLKYSEIQVSVPWRAALSMEYLVDSGYVTAQMLKGFLEDTTTQWINKKANDFVGARMDEIIERLMDKKKREREVMDIVRE